MTNQRFTNKGSAKSGISNQSTGSKQGKKKKKLAQILLARNINYSETRQLPGAQKTKLASGKKAKKGSIEHTKTSDNYKLSPNAIV